MAGVKRTQRTVRAAGLWYLLASTYLLARLLCNRAVLGAWAFDTDLWVEAAVIPLVQLGAMLLFRLDRRARPDRGAPSGGGPGAGGA